jgi:DNA (cytosine-5)-methyltransferase 1
MKLRALDLFCGAGGVTKGLQRAGFHVTGVDIKPQPRYCGELFYRSDSLTFQFSHTSEFVGGSGDIHPELCDRCGLVWDRHFDFVWASPPCQAFTSLRFMYNAKKHINLIPETRSRLLGSDVPYCIENVEGAPLGDSGNLIVLCGTMFGLRTSDGHAELRRHRLFETSFNIPLRPACQHNGRMVIGVYGGHGRDGRRVVQVTGHSGVKSKRDGTQQFPVTQRREAMGIDWMTNAELCQAIPPAYSEFIGRQILDLLTRH